MNEWAFALLFGIFDQRNIIAEKGRYYSIPTIQQLFNNYYN